MIDKMKQLMEVKRQAEALKRELDAAIIESEEVKGIKITMNAAQELKSLTLAKEMLSEGNKAKLEADLLRAVNAALKKSQSVAAQKMKVMTGLNIPGMGL